MFVAPALDACQDVRQKIGTGASVSEHAQNKLQKKDWLCAYLANTGTGCIPYCD